MQVVARNHMAAEALERAALMNSMTNYQRNQLGKRCRGSYRDMDIKTIRLFAESPHWKEQANG